jgi:hypothetical protein
MTFSCELEIASNFFAVARAWTEFNPKGKRKVPHLFLIEAFLRIVAGPRFLLPFQRFSQLWKVQKESKVR